MANLRVKATLDRSEYERGLDSMKNASKDLNQSFGQIGGIIAGVFGGNLVTGAISGMYSAIADSMGQARQEAVQLGRAAENIGINPSEFNEIEDTFKRFGQGGEEVTAMFGRLESARDKLLAGNPKAIKSFRDLGLSMEQVAQMDPKQLFDAISAAYAKAGGAGDVGTAAGDVFGKGMRNVGNQRAMKAYGGGQRFEPLFAPTDWDVVAIQMREIQKERRSQGLRNFWKMIQGAAAQSPHGVATGDVTAEIQRREEANAKRIEDNNAAIERAKQEKADRDAAINAENARYQKDLEDERNDEIEKGVHLTRPETDAYRRRGLIAGNAGGVDNNMTYAIARQHVQVSLQILEVNRRMEAKLAFATQHKTALRKIEERYPGLGKAGSGEEEEGVE